MTNFRKQKELAARALGVSTKRVKLNITNDEQKKAVKELISREGVRELIKDGTIKKIPKKGNSRTNANMIISQKKKGRRMGPGTRRGTEHARFNSKDKWMIKIRALRALLQKLKDEKRIDNKTYRALYMKAKGNFFRNKNHVLLYMQQNNLMGESVAAPKKEAKKTEAKVEKAPAKKQTKKVN